MVLSERKKRTPFLPEFIRGGFLKTFLLYFIIFR